MKHTAHSFLHLSLPTPPRLGWRGRIILFTSLTLTLYSIGFAAFIISLPTPFTTLPPNLQGLAVFTGGAGRVDAALTQIAQGFTGPILISGRHPHSTLPDILSQSGTPLTLQQQSQILIDSAQTTRQNIESLHVWSAYRHLNNVGIITSTYHTARVHLLTWWHTPGLSITLLPVQPEDTSLPTLFKEYNKLLATPLLR